MQEFNNSIARQKKEEEAWNIQYMLSKGMPYVRAVKSAIRGVQDAEKDPNSTEQSQALIDYFRRNHRALGFPEMPKFMVAPTKGEMKQFLTLSPEDRVLYAAEHPEYALLTSPDVRMKDGVVLGTALPRSTWDSPDPRFPIALTAFASGHVNAINMPRGADGKIDPRYPGILAHELAHLGNYYLMLANGGNADTRDVGYAHNSEAHNEEERVASSRGGDWLYNATKGLTNPQARLSADKARQLASIGIGTHVEGEKYKAEHEKFKEDQAKKYNMPYRRRTPQQSAAVSRTVGRYYRGLQDQSRHIQDWRFRSSRLPAFRGMHVPANTSTQWTQDEISRPEVDQEINQYLGERDE